jgi:hypothetical protein
LPNPGTIGDHLAWVGKLSLQQTSHVLRMTAALVRWLTQHTVCGRHRLAIADAGPNFDEEVVRAFDLALRGPWPNKHVPLEVSRELQREASGLCGLCAKECDRLEEAHIRRKGVELDHHCQHPGNLLLLDPTCHSRYDAGMIPLIAIEHAKSRVRDRLMENIDRDVTRERILREEIARLLASHSTYVSAASALSSLALGRDVTAENYTAAVGQLLAAGQELGAMQPRAGALLVGLAFEGELARDVDSFAYIDELAQPIPTREEFEDELDGYSRRDGYDTSPRLVAWAATVGAAYECDLGGEICVDPHALTDALVEHWRAAADESDCEEGAEDEEAQEGSAEEDASGERFDETKARTETFDAIVNSGVECGDVWGGTRLCAYHANQLRKND